MKILRYYFISITYCSSCILLHVEVTKTKTVMETSILEDAKLIRAKDIEKDLKAGVKETKRRAKNVKAEIKDVVDAAADTLDQVGDVVDAVKGKTRKGRKPKAKK